MFSYLYFLFCYLLIIFPSLFCIVSEGKSFWHKFLGQENSQKRDELSTTTAKEVGFYNSNFVCPMVHVKRKIINPKYILVPDIIEN